MKVKIYSRKLFITYIPIKEKNPNEHADHVATGEAIQCAIKHIRMPQKCFKGYSLSNAKNLLSPTELFWKVALFAAYEKAVYDTYTYSTLKEDADVYINWCIRPALCINKN